MNRHVFTVDVEDWYQVENLRVAVPPERWSGMPSRLEANVDRLLGLLSAHGVRATCFVLGSAAERCPQVVKRIAHEGHEIASHGWSHDLIYRQSPKLFEQETLRSKGLLEDLSGGPVRGYRASTFSVTSASLWALPILARVGFTYDSSIAPLRHDRYGIPDAPRQPFRMRFPDGESILEFPVASAGFLGARFPLGGGFFRLFPVRWADRALRRMARHGEIGMIYMHPWEIDPEQPRVKGLGATARFRHYVNLGATYRKLDRLLEAHEWSTMAESLEALGERAPWIESLTAAGAS